METIVFESKFAKIVYQKDTEILIVTYLLETENMDDDDFKAHILKLNDISEEYKPKYVLSDNRNRLYAYVPEIQEWTIKILVPTWTKNEVLKYAQVLSYDIIGKLSSIQIFEMGNKTFANITTNKIFDDYESALNWLKE